MNHKTPKPFLEVLGRPLFTYSLEVLRSLDALSEIVFVTDPLYRPFVPEGVLWAPPGLRRQDSLLNGLKALSSSHTWTLVHDAARPLIDPADILRLIEVGKETSGASLGSPVINTLKRVDEKIRITHTVDRDSLWELYTPQITETTLLHEGLELADKKGITVTDDTSLLDLLEKPATLVASSFPNIKATYPKDLYLIEALLSLKNRTCLEKLNSS